MTRPAPASPCSWYTSSVLNLLSVPTDLRALMVDHCKVESSEVWPWFCVVTRNCGPAKEPNLLVINTCNNNGE